MDGFLTFAHELIWQLLMNIADFFTTIGKALLGIFTSFGQYALIVASYFPGFSMLQKVLTVILLLILVAILGLVIYKLGLGVVRRIKHRHSEVRQEDLLGEISSLNKQVAELIDEKSKILAMKVSQLGLRPDEDNMVLDGASFSAGSVNVNGGSTTTGGGSGDNGEVRFPKLDMVDAQYAVPPDKDWNDTITLPEIMEGYRNFAASHLHLYYSPQIVRLFFSSMAASRLIILEGISGTGKTSLPYSVSRYLDNPAGLVSVQPSYRDRSELLGYFNEFTKRFNETEFLRHLYSAGYREEPSFIFLD